MSSLSYLPFVSIPRKRAPWRPFLRGPLFFLLLATAASADPIPPPSRVVVKDQCPGKFCSFGPWVIEEKRTLHSQPTHDAPPVATLDAGDTVTVLTGEVHAIPGVFHVHRSHESYAPGDRLRVLSYLGGGEWLIEVEGTRRAEHLGFSPWGGEPGRRCEVESLCWGTLEEEFDWHWWAQFKTRDGVIGWSKRWGR